MSEPTKTEQVEKALESYTSVEEMKAHSREIAETLECSRGLVYKVINKLAKTTDLKALPVSQEPVVKIEKGEEKEVISEAEEEELEEIEEPEELEEPEPEELEEEEKEELEEERQERLGDIFVRSLQRIFDIPVDQLGLSEKIGLSKQEAEDSGFLVLLLLSKHADIEAEENLLEITTVTHFGSLVGRGVAEWYKKRQEEEKEKEEEESKPEPPRAPPQEPETPETPETVGFVAKSEQDLQKLKESQRPEFMKRL